MIFVTEHVRCLVNGLVPVLGAPSAHMFTPHHIDHIVNSVHLASGRLHLMFLESDRRCRYLHPMFLESYESACQSDRMQPLCLVLQTPASGEKHSHNFPTFSNPPSAQWEISISFHKMSNHFMSLTNPSLPLKLHLFCKYAKTTICKPSCACVLACSQLFSSKELN